ncbi:hypothetical protein BCR42DRAFT_229520 [Absidia repens]|uniref:Uncharacterized protein n=1 Tax=Absidia repens TaxID=90262 RepID=A0A1X2ILA6_9FUNG|nr:hypothetical protein BCR42DRAFT_229520 [Absidia repens]
MYNVPFHLSNFNSQQQQQQQPSSTNNNNEDHKPFNSPLTADSPPGPSSDLLQQSSDLSYQKLPSSFNPLNSASPTPSHKSTPTMTNNSSNISGRTSFDIYDNTPTPSNFKPQHQPQHHPLSQQPQQQQQQQQQHSPHPTESISTTSSSRNSNVFYANNDDWVTSPHPSSSVVGNTIDQDSNDADDYGASPNSGTMDDELQQQQ